MGRKLIIHQPTNHYSNRYRYYNIFFDNLIKKLSEKNEVIVDRYSKDAHKGRVNVDLGWYDDRDFQIEMQDCEMIIEDYDTKETQILSVSDDLTPTSLNLQSYENTKKIFISQFIRDKVYHHVSKEYHHKYFPWIYFPSNEYDLEKYYRKRKDLIPQDNRMYFRGETNSRKILSHFNSEVFYGGNSIGEFDIYADELINFKMGLSVAGRGEMCYRDVEYMALGVPYIRFEYTTEFAEPLVPNFHYISVDRPDDLFDWMHLDRLGEKHHADIIINRYLEVKDDNEFLEFISNNAKNYYEQYLNPYSSIETTIKLLGYEI
jgi:hypothetical protein